MSDAFPSPEVLSTLRHIVGLTERLAEGQQQLLGGQQQLEAGLATVDTRLGAIGTRLEALETRLGALETRLGALEIRLDALEAGFATLTARVALLETGLDQTRHELLKLRVDVMNRLDRLQTTVDNVRDSMNVTLMMDQRVTKKLNETDKDRDDLFEQMMAMERQLITLALRIDAIEDQRH